MAQCIPISWSPDMSVLERRQARLKWLLQQQKQPANDTDGIGNHTKQISSFHSSFGLVDSLINGEKSGGADHSLGNGWPDFATACRSNRAAVNVGEVMKKRKPENSPNVKIGVENATVHSAGSKRMREAVPGGESKDTTEAQGPNNNKKEASTEGPRENGKASDSPKAMPNTDFIHVSARRGQATDSHSLAERVRRERISERMKYLQDLVPGCNKIIGKAGMLDEIINYVESLQRQVEFLSMKLAAVSPMVVFNIDGHFSTEISPAFNTGWLPMINAMTQQADPHCCGFNSLHQAQDHPGPVLGMSMNNNPDLELHRPMNAPALVADSMDSCFSVDSSCVWDMGVPNPFEGHHGTEAYLHSSPGKMF